MRSEVVTKKIRIAAWAMLIAQAGIILTGGIVRLTGSGLGCSDWPKCTPDSLVATSEMGIHGAIEFGNRLLAVALAILGVCIALLLWKSRKQRPDLFWLNIGLLAIVPVQAVVGGITVWTKLNPWVVAGHFVPSAVAVGVAAYFVRRTYDTGVRLRTKASTPLPTLGWIILGLTAIIVVFGVLTTGPGLIRVRRSRPATTSTTSGSPGCMPRPCGCSSSPRSPRSSSPGRRRRRRWSPR